MRLQALLGAGLLAALTAGCAGIGPNLMEGPVALQSRFDPAEVAWFSGRGSNTISGSAILRSYSGTIKTCAALPVVLFPVSAYGRERMRHLYGSETEGYNPQAGGHPADFVPDDPRYQTTAKTGRCDAHGRFVFANLPNGDYYLVATVTWRERPLGIDEGGSLMLRVKVADGDTRDVLLAH